jgi:hypothetical protein
MICPMVVRDLDVYHAWKMLILSMAEHQQHPTVDVTLDCLENVFDTPFFILKFINQR